MHNSLFMFGTKLYAQWAKFGLNFASKSWGQTFRSLVGIDEGRVVGWEGFFKAFTDKMEIANNLNLLGWPLCTHEVDPGLPHKIYNNTELGRG